MRLPLLGTGLAMGVALALALPLHAAPTSPDKTASPVEKVKKALDQTKEFDIDKKGLGKAVDALAEQSGVPIVLHPQDFPNYGNLGGAVAPGGPAGPMGGDPWTFPELTIKGKMKVRTALKKALEPHGMTYVILDDKVYITTQDTQPQRQVKQRVSLTLDNQKLSAALKQLSKDTATNIVLDPKVAKDNDNALSLDLDEVALDTAVKVLAVSSGLSSVRLGNVLYVTTTARAKELREESKELDPPPLPNLYQNFGMIGAIGFAGALGAGGAFGLVGGAPGGGAIDPAAPGGNREDSTDEKKPEKKDEKKDENKSSLLPTDANGLISVALLGMLSFTGVSAWWTRRLRRDHA